jgi:hypothetical protein
MGCPATQKITPGPIHPAGSQLLVAIQPQDPLTGTRSHHLLEMGFDIALSFHLMHLPG